MTSFAVQSTLGAVAPLVSKDKGSMGNRMDCAGAHIKNNAVTLLETAAVGGTAVGALAYEPAVKGLSKAFDGAMKFIGKIAKKPDLSRKVNEYLNKVTSNPYIARRKAAGLIAAILLPTLGYIAHKHSYKSGQIDQKYTDKAQFQKTL